MEGLAPGLVLFDVDGTLVSTGGAGKRALDVAFRARFGRSILEGTAAEVAYAGRTDPSILDDLIAAVGLEAGLWEETRSAFLETYFDALERDMEACAPEATTVGRVEVLLDRLERSARVHLGLLTGRYIFWARRSAALILSKRA